MRRAGRAGSAGAAEVPGRVVVDDDGSGERGAVRWAVRAAHQDRPGL
ncbi:hypothetical protein [Streptomyces sp. SAJ15]|nr:hypothetical protein [Streptomyces sp. SAJ15]